MTVQLVLDILRETFIKIIVISGPVLAIAMIVGVIISVIQATTQIQEQTLSFVPKLIAVFVMLMLVGNFMLNMLLAFTETIFKIISTL